MRKVSEHELLAALDDALHRLKTLVRAYDDGQPTMAFLLAVEVFKIMEENPVAQRRREALRFRSSIRAPEPANLLPVNDLIFAAVWADPPRFACYPSFSSPYPVPVPVREIDGRDWWTREKVFVASAAKSGSPPGQIPVIAEEVLPYSQRSKLTRKELVKLLRDKLGAHQTSAMPALLDELNHARSFGMEFVTNQFTPPSMPIPCLIPPVSAMMRQVAHECLEAYGIIDEYTLTGSEMIIGWNYAGFTPPLQLTYLTCKGWL